MSVVALASCDPYPAVADDEAPLRAAFAARGVAVHAPAWDAPIDWASFDAVLIRTTWDYHERRAEFVAWCERVAAVTRLFHGPRIIRWNTDKSYLATLAAAGVPLAETEWLAVGLPIAAALERVDRAVGSWGRAFLKPIVGANAWRTLAVSADPSARAAVRELLAGAGRDGALAAGFMLQPYLASVESEGERSLVWIDGAPAHALVKVPARGDYRVQEDWGARDFRAAPDAELVGLATAAVAAAEAALGERLLYARVDALRGRDGRLVLNELELVEPALFFRHGPESADRLADALLARL